MGTDPFFPLLFSLSPSPPFSRPLLPPHSTIVYTTLVVEYRQSNLAVPWYLAGILRRRESFCALSLSLSSLAWPKGPRRARRCNPAASVTSSAAR